jgi:hypothetical protein
METQETNKILAIEMSYIWINILKETSGEKQQLTQN